MHKQTIMPMRSVVVIAAGLIFCYTHLFAQERFSGERAFGYIEELCRPEFQGRRTGMTEARRAAEWIAAQFRAWGLEPGGDDGTFIQEFPMIVTRQTEKAHMKLLDGAFGPVQYIEGVDFTVYLNSGSGNFTAEVVFAGYGICEPAMGRDDYAGVDVRGKIVMIHRDLPQDGRDWQFANERDYKTTAAKAQGAVGLLILEKGDWPVRGGTIHEEGYHADLVACNISKKVALDLFSGSGKNLDGALRELGQKVNSFSLQKKMRLKATVKWIEPGVGENVVAILPGSDPNLQRQYIVVGGHMDHTGVDHFGHIYHGADDNASGAAVVMESARTFALRAEKPKRSILFVAFGGEEQGLRGSKHFAYHPPAPRENILAMLNFDMEGTGDGGAGIGGRNYFPEVIDEMVSAWTDSVTRKTRLGRGWGMGGSDHAHFVEQGIPAMGFYSTGGHPFYHRFEDVPGTINVASLQFVGDRAAEVLTALADASEELLYPSYRQGRFFLHHGDQIDWNLTRFRPHTFAETLQRDLKDLHNAAVRMAVVGLNFPLASMCMDTLYRQMDDIEQAVKNTASLLRYEAASAVDRAAGSKKIAVAVGLQGSELFLISPGHFRNLARMGLNVVQISDPQDPIIVDGLVGERGREMLKVCRDHSLILDWTIADTALLKSVLESYGGKLCWRLPLAQAEPLARFIRGHFKGAATLLVIECNGDEPVEPVSRLIDELGADRIHLSFPHHEARSLMTVAPWLQSLYRLRREAGGDNQAYKEMEKVMGRNLKKMPAAGG